MTERRHKSQEETAGVWEYQAINRLTGEVVILAVRLASGGRWKQKHVRLFQQTIDEVACKRVLGEESWCILGVLLGVLDWDNWLVIPQKQIGTRLGMTAPQVSRAMRQLKREGLIVQAEAPAPRSAYRLSAALAYRGSWNGWQKRRREETQDPGAVPA